MKKIITMLLLIVGSFASAQSVHKSKPKKHKSQKSIAAVLKGSRSSERTQNHVANQENLSRIQNDKQLASMEKAGYLVKITNKVKVDSRLNQKFHFVRPWTNKFLADIQGEFGKKFPGKKLKVNSAVRTVAYQKKLQKRNGNAAPTKGDRASSHPTGATVDIAKKPLTLGQIKWVRKYLYNFENKKLIEATEEKKQSVFHIMVFESYENH